jgi:iron complex outermembrane receptor protein
MLFNKIKISNWSYNINYKWVQGFLFEGSPQFTGEIESYDVVDVQISKKIPSMEIGL